MDDTVQRDVVLLEYWFMFHPDVFEHITEFENALFRFLDSEGVVGELINTGGNANRKILLLSKKPDVIPDENEKVGVTQEEVDILNAQRGNG